MRTGGRFLATACALLLVAATISSILRVVQAQNDAGRIYRPDTRRALSSRTKVSDAPARKEAYSPRRSRASSAAQLREQSTVREGARRLPTARPDKGRRERAGEESIPSAPLARVSAGTPLSRVLHVSQLSLTNTSGTNEQYVDQTGDLVADERTAFDADGGSYDIAVGRSGSRYEVFTAVDTKGTTGTGDDVPVGVLVIGQDANGDYVRDPGVPLTFDLRRDYSLPSAVSVVSGTSSNGSEFVVVSSSGYYNSEDPDDPNNEASPGVLLLVRDFNTGGFDPSRTRELTRVGDNQLFNANALALLPSGDLLIADFQSNEIRIVRDTNSDRIPDTLDPDPFHTFPFSSNAEDAPLDIAANSRGVVFSHTAGNSTRLLAIYDTNGDGVADTDQIVVEGLSIDNNLVLHGLTVGRDGTVYVIEDAMGEHDLAADGGNGGIPLIQAFPDPALNGVLRDGSIFALADDEFTQALSGLSFGVDTVFGPVANLSMTNSASMTGAATSDGLATIKGAGLTRGLSGATESEAAARGVRVSIEGASARVFSFSDSQINIHVPSSLGAGVGSVVVSVNGVVIAADDETIVNANPGLFTLPQTGAGETVALLVSEIRYTRSPFNAQTGGQPSVVALFGTGWRNNLPVSVTIGGKPAAVQYAGASGGFPGLDQINVAIPAGTSGAATVIVKTADGSTSRSDAFITVQ